MSRSLLGLGVTLLVFISLAATAPARLLTSLLPSDRILAQGFSGTLWRGSVSRVLVQAGPGYLHLGTVDWTLHPLSLLLLSPRLSVESRWGRQLLAGDVLLHGTRDVELRDFSASLAASLVRQYAPVGLTGTFSGQFRQLRLRDGLPQAVDGRLVWQEAGWQSPVGPRPLGSYAVDLQQLPGELLTGEVHTLSGPVQASGSAQLEGRLYRVDILVGTDGAMEPQLQQALSLVASPEGDTFRLALNGEFQ
ncbi:MAG: type II secretion system protein GspN [Haliea sp.]|jgi:hypothetical protein|nr:type II secretion system protein GspN [Haliea sp.]